MQSEECPELTQRVTQLRSTTQNRRPPGLKAQLILLLEYWIRHSPVEPQQSERVRESFEPVLMRRPPQLEDQD